MIIRMENRKRRRKKKDAELWDSWVREARGRALGDYLHEGGISRCAAGVDALERRRRGRSNNEDKYSGSVHDDE